jgi:hypothetical protein
MAQRKPIPKSAHELRQIAVRAEVDPRTVATMLAGGATRPMVKARIIRAMKEIKAQ